MVPEKLRFPLQSCGEFSGQHPCRNRRPACSADEADRPGGLAHHHCPRQRLHGQGERRVHHGDFVRAEMIDGEEIIIPVTEESSGRSSGARAHPLCDQIGYICKLDEEKNSLYLEQLKKWCDSYYSHPMVEAVYSYVSKGNVLHDLERSQCITREKEGNVKNINMLT